MSNTHEHSDSISFYQNIDSFASFDDFSNEEHYHDLPRNWCVVITDVVNSTETIEEGRYRDVNAIGVASIVNVLNSTPPVDIPFVFGGDGATLCIPASYTHLVLGALKGTRQMARDNFDLELRTGIVPIENIRSSGHNVQVGKYSPSPHYSQAMFAGSGLSFAEDLVKHNPKSDLLIQEPFDLDPEMQFSGFNCRWNEVPSPHGENVTLLIRSLRGNKVYNTVFEKIVMIYGSDANHHPLHAELMSLALKSDTLASQSKIESANEPTWKRWTKTGKLITQNMVGNAMMKSKATVGSVDLSYYRDKLIQNTDYRKFDGSLRMIISGTAYQRQQLQTFLERLHSEGKIVYGLHSDAATLITCMITDFKTNHIHFVDGSEGGYAVAAQQLKKQLAELDSTEHH